MRNILTCLALFLLLQKDIHAQGRGINWSPDGKGYISFKDGGIVQTDPKDGDEKILIKKESLTPPGESSPLKPQSFDYSNNNKYVLLFTNTVKVWRYNTKGDYWILDASTGKLRKLGKGLPDQSLMFAKFSPDSRYVGFVSEHNIYVEDVVTGITKRLTTDGTRKLINGTFDWVYEEEFGDRDGFRWSDDSKQIAFWQVDATKIRDYYMINNTDSVYSRIIPVEYPKVGEAPSPVRIGVTNISNGRIKWMNVPGDPQQHYIPRMEWSGPDELVLQQLDRKQQESKLMYCNTTNGNCATFWAEGDKAWVDLNTSDPKGWNWINKGKEFLWVSEKDGWRHIYKISRDGKTLELITKGNYDIEDIKAVDESNNYVYFTASPTNATQLYLYRSRINNPKDEPEMMSDSKQAGVHRYDISPNGRLARHSFSSHNVPPVSEWISLPDHKALTKNKSIENNLEENNDFNVEYFKITTDDNIVLDAWMSKPKDFDPAKKYPIIFYVYGEPAASTVMDSYGGQSNFLYTGDPLKDGYILASVDSRGTPSLKGAAWRKSIYRKIGVTNIRDIAMGAKKILENPYIDKDRVAVWGWSGGGSSTLNLLFQYPGIFKTGIAIAAVANQLLYDNIYQERYMGLPQENKEDFVKGSPMNHVQGLQGNLLYIHGTGDDNVHYDNAEMLLNELIKYNKQFRFMAYPNRSHSISEGEGTFTHLSTLYTSFMKEKNPPGAK